MRRRWNVGFVMAIALAIAAAMVSGAPPAPEAHVAAPMEVTLALQSDGVTLRFASGAFTLTLEI